MEFYPQQHAEKKDRAKKFCCFCAGLRDILSRKKGRRTERNAANPANSFLRSRAAVPLQRSSKNVDVQYQLQRQEHDPKHMMIDIPNTNAVFLTAGFFRHPHDACVIYGVLTLQGMILRGGHRDRIPCGFASWNIGRRLGFVPPLYCPMHLKLLEEERRIHG